MPFPTRPRCTLLGFCLGTMTGCLFGFASVKMIGCTADQRTDLAAIRGAAVETDAQVAALPQTPENQALARDVAKVSAPVQLVLNPDGTVNVAGAVQATAQALPAQYAQYGTLAILLAHMAQSAWQSRRRTTPPSTPVPPGTPQ